MNRKPRIVICLTCGTHVFWAPDSAWRPFCSERCKLIDFGAWATEQYRVSVAEDKDDPGSTAPAGGSA